MEKGRLVPVGRIIRTHGLRGAVKIYPYGESLAEQQLGGELYLRGIAPDGRDYPVTLMALSLHGRLWTGQFQEITNRDEAQRIVGSEVFLPEDRLPPTSEDEYYHYQLIGLTVETTEGKRVGILRSIIETGGNDVYVIGRDGDEILIPALADVVILVDLEQGRMVIDPPEGLIDDQGLTE